MSATLSPRRSSGGSKQSWTELPRWAAPLAVLVVLAVQPVLRGLDPERDFVVFGFFDWVGHFATGVVLIAALRPSTRMAAGIVLGSLLIDLDHLPAHLGSDILTAGTPRPYTHSLLSLAVVLAAARLRRSELLLGAAIGLAGHLVRDLGGGDVVLLWPLTDAEQSVPFAVYVVLLTLIAAQAAATPTALRTPRR
jgi:inner membrane protein